MDQIVIDLDVYTTDILFLQKGGDKILFFFTSLYCFIYIWSEKRI